jgi:hypothetical protein
MEWLILLLVVPAIVVPVVLLCGFAGCHFAPAPVEGGGEDGGGPITVIPPTVTAEAKNVDHITVSWTDPELNPQKYHVVRNPGTATEKTFDVDPPPTVFDDTPWHAAPDYTPLHAATEYTYQVSTTTADGTSAPSMLFTVSTFQQAFGVANAPTPQPNFAADVYCYVQRISVGPQLKASGVKVGIKVQGAPASNVTINRIYISRVAAGGHPWDSAGDLTPVLTSALTLPDGQPRDLEPIPYNLDMNQPLIIAFDFTATPGADTISVVSPQPGVTSYFKAGVQQASVPTRDPGYSTGPSQIYLVVTIGVP